MYSSLMVHKKERKRDRKKKEFAAEGKPNDIIEALTVYGTAGKGQVYFIEQGGNKGLF